MNVSVPHLCLLVFCLSTLPSVARGAIINGGPTGLLSQSYADQLETWLGEGPIEVTQIYAKATGDTSTTFHHAVNGQGRTFVLIEVLAGNYDAQSRHPGDVGTPLASGSITYYDTNGIGHTVDNYSGKMAVSLQIIGGYNPQNWSSNNNYNVTPSNDDRTAFLFNLTSTDIQRQNLSAQGLVSSGQFQTYNDNNSGPTFGFGHDIWVSSSLSGGFAVNRSYGGTSFNDNILMGGAFSTQGLSYGRIEVFTIENVENSAVPEPTTLFIVAGLGLAFFARRCGLVALSQG
jgi:hypothetical protein